MARGRHYYDPILQTGATVESAPDLSRIELFPAGAESLGRLPQDQGKWIGRRINEDGSVAEEAPGDFDHDRALAQAQELWPGLTVYELNAEHEDSTWEGVGPSPRLWAASNAISKMVAQEFKEATPEHRKEMLRDVGRLANAIADGPTDDEVQLRVLPIGQPGNYVLLDDIAALLGVWADQYEQEKNPSAALALREAVDALKDIG